MLDPHPLDLFEGVHQLVANLHHRFERDLRLLEGDHHLILRRLALGVLLQHLVGVFLELVHALKGVLKDLLERALALRGRRLRRQPRRDRAPQWPQSADLVDHPSIPGSAARSAASPWPPRPPSRSLRRRAMPRACPPSRPSGSRSGTAPNRRPRGGGPADAPRGTPTGPRPPSPSAG